MANGSGRLEIAAAAVLIVAVLAISLGRDVGDRAAADVAGPTTRPTATPPIPTSPPEPLALPGTRRAAQLDEYAAAVAAVCQRATDALSQWEHEHANLRGTSVFHFQTLDDAAAWSAEVIRLAHESIAQLSSMPSPGSVATLMVGDIIPALEASLEPLRQIEAAANSGDFDAVESLMRSRIERTHTKDELVRNVGWGALAEALERCPLALGV